MSNLTPELNLERAVRELREGDFVYVGQGLLERVLTLLPDAMELWLYSPDGVPGGTMYPTDDYMDARLIDAGKGPGDALVPLPYSSTQSFAVVLSETADVLLLEDSSDLGESWKEGLPPASRALVVSLEPVEVKEMAARYSSSPVQLPIALQLFGGTGDALERHGSEWRPKA